MFARTMHIPTRREIDSSESFSAWSMLMRWLSGSKAS
jgi:hypothetical protein